jgi:hypothetical protein
MFSHYNPPMGKCIIIDNILELLNLPQLQIVHEFLPFENFAENDDG